MAEDPKASAVGEKHGKIESKYRPRKQSRGARISNMRKLGGSCWILRMDKIGCGIQRSPRRVAPDGGSILTGWGFSLVI
jgi:hypothetical protein